MLFAVVHVCNVRHVMIEASNTDSSFKKIDQPNSKNVGSRYEESQGGKRNSNWKTKMRTDLPKKDHGE